ncbi:ABC transporter substrate-binding protein [Paenibacillus sp. Marseille-Q4541]|uniref:ABC transporter substrate-binding protein n=1 Tax=Paenibacillus sp. Marseille-Q4541 TaxID=2831522 RepID=UPI001BA76F17|nr:ABC transporter substrate-binding protein [Paenibacillus sp. Marseille-Q4541]
MKHVRWLRNIVSLILVSGLLLSACDTAADQPKKVQTGSTSSEQLMSGTSSDHAGENAPVRGGSMNIALQDDPKVMNPLYAGDRVTLTLNQSLYAPLFYMNSGKKTYALAESAYSSKDYLTYIVKLRKGLTWHDGEAITADDIVYTVEQIMDEQQNSPFRSQYVFDGKPVKAVKVNDLTVKFVLPSPSPSFEGALIDFYPIPQHVFQGEKNILLSSKNDHPIGSGPFKFKEYTPGEEVILERFEDYYGGAPYLDNITYQIILDPYVANQALSEGEVQLSMVDIEDYETLNDTGQFDLITYPEGRLQYMVFNMNIPKMKKREVREAIAYALDKEELIRISYLSNEFADPASSILTPDTLYHTSNVRTYDYNPEKSKKLLEQANIKDMKIRLAFSAASKPQVNQALYIQQKLKAVGILVELKPMEAMVYDNRRLDINNTDFDLSLAGYIMGQEPTAYQSLYMSDGVYNYSRSHNKELDALWKQASVEVNQAVRQKLYVQIQQKIAKELSVWPIAYTKSVIAVSKGYGGLEQAIPEPVVLFRDLSKIYMIE